MAKNHKNNLLGGGEDSGHFGHDKHPVSSWLPSESNKASGEGERVEREGTVVRQIQNTDNKDQEEPRVAVGEKEPEGEESRIGTDYFAKKCK